LKVKILVKHFFNKVTLIQKQQTELCSANYSIISASDAMRLNYLKAAFHSGSFVRQPKRPILLYFRSQRAFWKLNRFNFGRRGRRTKLLKYGLLEHIIIYQKDVFLFQKTLNYQGKLCKKLMWKFLR